MMWLGEQITERGIGNGISLIIFIGIIARFPHSIVDQFMVSQNIIIALILVGCMVAIVAAVVLITQGTRRIPVQYAKRVVGRKVYGGVTQYIPMRVNTAGEKCPSNTPSEPSAARFTRAVSPSCPCALITPALCPLSLRNRLCSFPRRSQRSFRTANGCKTSPGIFNTPRQRIRLCMH